MAYLRQFYRGAAAVLVVTALDLIRDSSWDECRSVRISVGVQLLSQPDNQRS